MRIILIALAGNATSPYHALLLCLIALIALAGNATGPYHALLLYLLSKIQWVEMLKLCHTFASGLLNLIGSVACTFVSLSVMKHEVE